MIKKVLSTIPFLLLLSSLQPVSANQGGGFWTDYSLGIAGTLCQLHKKGIISSNDAKDAWVEYISDVQNVPSGPAKNAKSEILESFANCPI